MANILILKWPHNDHGDWGVVAVTALKLGHIVFTTDYRPDAIGILSRHNIDLVITDQPVVLIEAQERGIYCATRIIVLSSFFLIANNHICPWVKKTLRNLWGVAEIVVFKTQFDLNCVSVAIRDMLAEPQTIQ